MTVHNPLEIGLAVARLPAVCAVLAAAHDRGRAGVLVLWAMPCAKEPPLVCVSVRKGNVVEPLIRDSRAFSLSLIEPAHRLAVRAFDDTGAGSRGAAGVGGSGAVRGRRSVDPFDALGSRTLVTGSPVLRGAVAGLDCELVAHVDLEEAEHELYVGRIVAAFVAG